MRFSHSCMKQVTAAGTAISKMSGDTWGHLGTFHKKLSFDFANLIRVLYVNCNRLSHHQSSRGIGFPMSLCVRRLVMLLMGGERMLS